jgi:hypothetical protein
LVIIAKVMKKLITLQIVKKNVLIRVSAIFVLIWYSLGIIGFNVHTCSASDRSFIVTFLEDMSCSSIHPSDHCETDMTCCCCCSHHAQELPCDSDESLDEPECCTDEYQVITSMTDREDDSRRYHAADLVSLCMVSLLHDDSDTVQHHSALRSGIFSRVCHDARGIRVLFNVWRI